MLAWRASTHKESSERCRGRLDGRLDAMAMEPPCFKFELSWVQQSDAEFERGRETASRK